MPDRLKLMLEMQRSLQIESYGSDPMTLEGDERGRQFVDMSAALIFELGEASDEIGWKPWAKGEKARYINREAYLKELVDAFHFFMNLWLLGRGTPEELYRMYMDKHKINAQRQVEGYDSRTTKCSGPHCSRALDDYPQMATRDPETGLRFHSQQCWSDWLLTPREGSESHG